MNCANHVDVPAAAFCRTCGKPLCSSCVRDVRGVIYCEECLASHLSGTMPPPGTTAVPPGVEPPSGSPSPGLAAILGFIPGVGAMYNGEYAKGFVHVLIFATLIWMTAHVNGIFGLGIAAFVIYMPIEAYQTARARQMGLPAPDPLGLNRIFSSAGPTPTPKAVVTAGAVPAADGNPLAGGNPATVVEGELVESDVRSRIPIGAFVLIGLGVLFLLNEMDVVNFDRLWRFWPLVLIAVGIRVLMRRRGMGW
jgi:cell wall-active antibiotic response 4TMS protein YvqF/B-box zinc finger protein